MSDRTLLAICAYAVSYHSPVIGAGQLTRFGEEKLVDDNVVRVNLVVCQLLDESFRLVQR